MKIKLNIWLHPPMNIGEMLGIYKLELTAASYQETASCRYTTHWYAQWSPMVQNRGHSPWKRKEH